MGCVNCKVKGSKVEGGDIWKFLEEKMMVWIGVVVRWGEVVRFKIYDFEGSVIRFEGWMVYFY